MDGSKQSFRKKGNSKMSTVLELRRQKKANRFRVAGPRFGVAQDFGIDRISVPRAKQTLTVDEFAKLRAKSLAREAHLTREQAEDYSRKTMKALLKYVMNKDKEIEFPYGSKVKYLKIGPNAFQIRFVGAKPESRRPSKKKTGTKRT